MAPIPDSQLPGHRRLHERAIAALDRCVEEQDVDFKESGSWDSLRWRITHAALGMGNLRDGGIVIIGLSERNSTWSLDGISDVDLRTFDPDDINAQVNAYVSPYVALDIVTVVHGGKRFLAIYCREFHDTPLVCKKNGPDKSGIVAGRVYVRPPGMARTTAVTDARQMHDLLELAAEKRSRAYLEVSRRLGVLPGGSQSTESAFDQELEGL